MPTAADPLPIDSLRPAFTAALAAGNVVVTAATGSGKSTRLPLWAAEQGAVLVVQPRRLAAASLAGFLAEAADEAVGERVGYAVRFEQRLGPATRICFVTPGIALRWLADGRLQDYRTVILDEFHERRWDTDLLLALLHRERRQRLVLTSATLAAARLARYVAAELLEAQGRQYPVAVRHVARQGRDMPSRQELAPRVAEAVRQALTESGGDVLVFLPGRGEIQAAEAELRGVEADLVALHATAPVGQQRRALNPGPRRRVILATNVAETSLTVPGITAVVDSGLERRTHRRNGRTVLGLQPIARSSAEQRAGRAGRLAPGLCLRLWGEHAPLQQAAPPEVLREDLADLVLAAACAGTPASVLDFPDPSPAASLEQAEAALRELGALDAAGAATAQGRRLFALPVDPVWARLLTAMPDRTSRGFMADLVAGLSAGGRWLRLDGREAERLALEAALPRRCDATLRVAALRGELPGLRIEARGRAEARRLAGQLRDLLGLPALPATLDTDPQPALRAALAAVPRMVYLRRERRPQAMGNGRDEILIGEDSLLSTAAQAALCFDDHSVPGRGTRQTLTVGTSLAPVAQEDLVAAGLAQPELAEPAWDGERLTARRLWRYAGRVIGDSDWQPQGSAARAAVAELVLAGTLLAPAGERLREDLAAWRLYLELGLGEGEAPEPADWLQRRLAELGLERGEDLPLIEPEDLHFAGIPEWEREGFERKYPREVKLPDLRMAVHYDVRRRRVTVEKVSGTRRRDPQRWELPAWPGWRVQYQRASRVVDVT